MCSYCCVHAVIDRRGGGDYNEEELHPPQPSVLIVGVIDDGTSCGELHTGHGGHRPCKH